jgi:hypothetical protein
MMLDFLPKVGQHHLVAGRAQLAQGVVGAHRQARVDLGVGLGGLHALGDQLAA